MTADFFHHGHINILIKANKLGNVIVGLITDKGIKSYKEKPIIAYAEVYSQSAYYLASVANKIYLIF